MNNIIHAQVKIKVMNSNEFVKKSCGEWLSVGP